MALFSLSMKALVEKKFFFVCPDKIFNAAKNTKIRRCFDFRTVPLYKTLKRLWNEKSWLLDNLFSFQNQFRKNILLFDFLQKTLGLRVPSCNHSGPKNYSPSIWKQKKGKKRKLFCSPYSKKIVK